MKLQDVILRAIAKKITWVDAAEIAGLSPLTIGRMRQKYEAFGYDGLYDQARHKRRVHRVPLAARRVTELSGGERQMVAVARALAQEPQCLLLDEPSAALDLKHRAALMRTLAALRDAQGLTALVVTHDLHLIDPLFDHVFALRGGLLAAEGRPEEVLTDAVLADVYEDPHVRTRRVEGRTLIWSN